MLTVSLGNDPKISISALYICSAVPSKNLPQPATKRVSPEYQYLYFNQFMKKINIIIYNNYKNINNNLYFYL